MVRSTVPSKFSAGANLPKDLTSWRKFDLIFATKLSFWSVPNIRSTDLSLKLFYYYDLESLFHAEHDLQEVSYSNIFGV